VGFVFLPAGSSIGEGNRACASWRTSFFFLPGCSERYSLTRPCCLRDRAAWGGSTARSHQDDGGGEDQRCMTTWVASQDRHNSLSMSIGLRVWGSYKRISKFFTSSGEVSTTRTRDGEQADEHGEASCTAQKRFQGGALPIPRGAQRVRGAGDSVDACRPGRRTALRALTAPTARRRAYLFLSRPAETHRIPRSRTTSSPSSNTKACSAARWPNRGRRPGRAGRFRRSNAAPGKST